MKSIITESVKAANVKQFDQLELTNMEGRFCTVLAVEVGLRDASGLAVTLQILMTNGAVWQCTLDSEFSKLVNARQMYADEVQVGDVIMLPLFDAADPNRPWRRVSKVSKGDRYGQETVAITWEVSGETEELLPIHVVYKATKWIPGVQCRHCGRMHQGVLVSSTLCPDCILTPATSADSSQWDGLSSTTREYLDSEAREARLKALSCSAHMLKEIVEALKASPPATEVGVIVLREYERVLEERWSELAPPVHEVKFELALVDGLEILAKGTMDIQNLNCQATRWTFETDNELDAMLARGTALLLFRRCQACDFVTLDDGRLAMVSLV